MYQHSNNFYISLHVFVFSASLDIENVANQGSVDTVSTTYYHLKRV